MKNKFLLSVSCFVLCIGAFVTTARPALGQEMGSLSYYTGTTEDVENMQDWRVFLQYQLYREPCQRYQKPPAPYVLKGCDVVRAGNVTREEPVEIRTIEPAAGESKAPLVYTVYFDVDKSAITDAGKQVIDKSVQEMKEAKSVSVSGYTSTTGSEEHNMGLSQRRADAVARELSEAGVDMKSVEQKAYGETNLAVPTGDNVEMPANRRAVIEFTR